MGLYWIYLFCLCVSLLDATEDSTELLYFPSSVLVGVVDDSWHQSFLLDPASPLIAGVAGTITNLHNYSNEALTGTALSCVVS